MKKNGENDFNKISSVSIIDQKNIDKNNYFLTLVNEAAEKNILHDKSIDEMHVHISDILADTIWQYTSGKSTSVTEENAEELIKSIIYILDFFCIYGIRSSDILNNDLCVEMLNARGGIKNCYKAGVDYIDKLMATVRTLYERVYATKTITTLHPYNKTILEDLPKNIKRYNKYFSAHALSININYMTAMIPQLRGILFLEEYLTNLYIENIFCSVFTPKYISDVIKYYIDDPTANIFEAVFRHIYISLFSKEIKNHEITVESANLNISQIIAQLKITDSVIIEYLKRYNKRFSKIFS